MFALWVFLFGVFLLMWALAWQRHARFAFGILLGLGVAWLAGEMIQPLTVGREHMPVWVPPLPFAIVALGLFVFGALVWFRGGKKTDRGDGERRHS